MTDIKLNINFTQQKPKNPKFLCLFIEGAESKESSSKESSSKHHKIKLNDLVSTLDAKYNGIISKTIDESASFQAKFGQSKSLTVLDKDGELQTLYLIGTGSAKDLTEAKLQDLGGHVAKILKGAKTKEGYVEVSKLGDHDESFVAANIAFGALLGSYNFDKYLTKEDSSEDTVLEELNILLDKTSEAKAHFAKIEHMVPAIYIARDVINEPGNVVYPESYSEIIESTLSPLGVKVEIIGEAEMRNLGLNTLLGVGQGSSKESKLVVMVYNGGHKDESPVALVGKGVTFDTGGISIKPSRNMHEMKYDMAGSATVFGTVMSLASRKAKVNVVGVVGLVENMPGGNAQRPGDVVKSLSGQTVEVLDTDAEGRLVLADALWYTQDRFKPKLMIDLATLTGAVRIALGTTFAGLFSNDEKLAEKLLEAGKSSGEILWRLPLHETFDKMIESSIADVANLGNPPGFAGSSTAAQFLQRFVNKTPWAHLDIAGVADSGKDSPTAPKGAVGFGIRLLNKLIHENYEQ